MQDLKQSTAATTKIGPCLDSTGAEYTGLAIGDVTLDKNGTEAAMASAATLTHEGNGIYELVFTTGNTDTLGRAMVYCNKSTYQFPPKEFMVRPATVYDALNTNAAGGANGFLLSLANNRVDLGNIIGTALTETSAGYLAAGFKKLHDVATPVFTLASIIQTGDSYSYLTTNLGALGVNLSAIPKTGFKLASDGLAAISAWTVNITGTLSGSVGSISGITFPSNFASLVIDGTGRVNAFLIGILTSVFTEGATGRIAAAFKQFFNIASPAATMDHGILVDTVTTTTTATNLTNAATSGDLTATMKTSAQTAANDALVALNLDHLLAVAAVSGDAVDNSIIARMTSKSATPSFASFVNTTDALEALRDNLATAVALSAVASSASSAESASTLVNLRTLGITSLLQILGAMACKQTADATAISELNGTGAGSGTFAGGSSDSLEGIRDRGDAAWATATGFSTLDAAGVRTAVGMASANLDTQLAAIPTTIRLKKNTAFSGFAFPMLDTAGDPATGLTVTGQVSLDGAAFANLTNAISEISAGAYKVNLAAADVNGNDALFKFTATGAKTLFIKVVTQV